MDAEGYRSLIAGERRGAVAGLARAGLSAAAVPYGLAVQLRNRGYDASWLRSVRAGVPVVSVGNLTLGGTGKTPLVEYLARWMADRGVRVVILSRGYGSAPGGKSDEARVLEQNLPGVPHLLGGDRVALAEQAVRELGAELLVLDDGFQHRRLARDLDVVVLDALDPFGLERLFPRGMLREPVRSLERADLVVLSRSDLVTEERREEIRREVERWAGEKPWIETRHAARSLRSAGGVEEAVDLLGRERVAAFCGIGNPGGFSATLEQVGCMPVAFRVFPDHYAYREADVAELGRWAAAARAELVVTTQKDLVKLELDELGGRPLWALKIALEITSGEAELAAQLETLLSAAGRSAA